MRQESFHAFRDLDEIGAGLALHIHDHGPVIVGPAGELGVLYVVEHHGHVRQAHWRAVAIGQHQGLVIDGLLDLVVDVDGIVLAYPVQRSLGLVHVGRNQDGAYIL